MLSAVRLDWPDAHDALDARERRMRIGLVGCGPMARHHAEVAVAQGDTIAAVCTTGPSRRRDAFVRDFGVGRACDRIEDLPAGDLDALILATSWDRTADVAERALATGRPCLIEKPVALTSARIAGWLRHPSPAAARTLVGYNRRFYDVVPEVVEALAGRELISAELSIPAPRDAEIARSLAWTPAAGLLYRASHPLDLLLYLLGDIAVDRMHRHGGGHTAYDGLLLARGGTLPVHLQVHLGAPARVRLALHFTDRIYELSPLETLTVYEGLDVAEPTREHPVRRYDPHVVHVRHTDMTHKPGLGRQLEALRGIAVNGRKPAVGCTLAQAERLTRLCEAIADDADGGA